MVQSQHSYGLKKKIILLHTFRTWGHRADLGVEVQLSFPDPWEAVWAQTAAGSEQKAL